MEFISGGAITIELNTTIEAIVATGVLHNICENDGVPLPEENLNVNLENDANDAEMYERNYEPQENAVNFRARFIRERFS